MKLLFITTINPKKQGDYLELSLVYGLRKILGNNFVEYPKKKILYGDFSESPINDLHGKGFTYCTDPIQDTTYDRSKIKLSDFDIVLMGSGHMYSEKVEIKHSNIWYTDGNDLYGNSKRLINYNGEIIIGCQFLQKCFKRELVEEFPTVYPTGFGIPSNKINAINLNIKNKLFQSTAPSNACFYENSNYKFNNENEYYKDMQESWFGLSCRKGGWDCLRHYEIMANGSVLLFKDFDKKPKLCEPNCPAISYSNKEELDSLMNRLIVNNKPTEKYLNILKEQRTWLLTHGTCESRAIDIIKILLNNA
jgi:hypothetical protein